MVEAVSKRRSLHEITDDELEGMIRGLPSRAPSADLRRRVLSGAAARAPRRRIALLPAYALAALVLLATADVLVLRWQSADLGRSASYTSATAAAQSQQVGEDEVEWLRDLGVSSAALRLALLAEPRAEQDSRSALLREPLNESNGS